MPSPQPSPTGRGRKPGLDLECRTNRPDNRTPRAGGGGAKGPVRGGLKGSSGTLEVGGGGQDGNPQPGLVQGLGLRSGKPVIAIP